MEAAAGMRRAVPRILGSDVGHGQSEIRELTDFFVNDKSRAVHDARVTEYHPSPSVSIRCVRQDPKAVSR